MILQTAWKNVWRNRVRSLVVILSVTIGIFGGVFMVAVMNGAIEQRVDAALNEELAHIHVNLPGFRDNYAIQMTLPESGRVIETVLGTPGVRAVAPRIILTGMASSASKSSGVQITGINPADERKVFRLHSTTVAGTGDFFETGSNHQLAYIGHELAKELNIIRYLIDEGVLENLSALGLPETVIQKLTPYKGYRFKSEKEFKNEVKSLLSVKEQHAFGKAILEEAWSFRERSKMTLTFLDSQQAQTGAVFRIAGIYDTRNSLFEMSQVLVKNDDLAQLAGLSPGQYHQLIIRLEETGLTEEAATALKQSLPGLEVMHWKEIQPDLAMMTDMVQMFYAVFMAIILAALAFGIVNTMLMVVLERTKELGMLTAIGMNKKRVFNMIMLESVFLSLVGGVAGMVISEAVIGLTSRKGIQFSNYAEGLEAMGFTAHIYPNISPSFFVTVTLLIIITGILSSVYPALKALKLDPADALRTE